MSASSYPVSKPMIVLDCNGKPTVSNASTLLKGSSGRESGSKKSDSNLGEEHGDDVFLN